MTGFGSSIGSAAVPRHPDNVRSHDLRMEAPPEGCAWRDESSGAVKLCFGPPDWKVDDVFYCIDHVNEMLCCGARLSPEQRRQILDRPNRKLWLVRQRQLEGQLADEEFNLADFDRQFDPIVNDPSEHSFSWRQHLAEQNKK